MKKAKFDKIKVQSVLKQAGVSQRDIAERLHCGEVSVSRAFKKGIMPTWKMEIVAELCRVTLDDLLSGIYRPAPRVRSDIKSDTQTITVPLAHYLELVEKATGSKNGADYREQSKGHIGTG